MGKLYAVDMRLRPSGQSGSLAVSLAEFRRYYGGGGGQLWERQALTRARAVHGDPGFAAEVEAAAREAAYTPAWSPATADGVRAMRQKLEGGRCARDLKRGPGGLADVEFLVQLFQLKYGGEWPALRTTSTRAALAALRDTGLITAEEHTTLRSGYDFLRRVEGRLRLVTNRAPEELPDDAAELDKLAWRLGDAGPGAGGRLCSELARHTGPVRALFARLCGRERGA
jgi:glutamate-ammonia-ligase adenylyltransferase